jgi:amino acid transporter
VDWTIASMIITVISFVVIYATLYPSTDEEDKRIDFTNLIIGSINLVISFVTAIITLFWFHRANENIHTFGANQKITLLRIKHIILRDRYVEGEIPYQVKAGSNPALLNI